MSALTDALAFVLSYEGGFVSDPVDHGGATNFGITQRTYDTWRANKKLPSEDVKHLTRDDACDIYTAMYYNRLDCDRLAGLCPHLATVMLDSAVQHGPRWAAVTLQRTVGAPVDGLIGPATLMAVKLWLAQKGAVLLLTGFLERRKGYYQGILAGHPDQERFRRGWARRLNGLCEHVGIRPVWVTT